MVTLDRNPFRPNKFELHSRPLVWISPLATRVMKEEQSFYIAGARGSGKTSILKAVDSIEFTRNESLRDQVKPLKHEFVGVYMRAQDLFTESFRHIRWETIAPGSDPLVFEYRFLSALIEAEAGGKLLQLATEWRALGIVRYKPHEALDEVERFFTRFPWIRAYDREGQGDPLARLGRCLTRYRRDLARSLNDGEFKHLKDLLIEEPLEIVTEVARQILPLMKGRKTPPATRLRIAVDECDYLSRTQQIALNTIVRKTRAPVSFVLAYVNTSYEPTTTLFRNLDLNEADREVVPLTYEVEDQFADLCEAIVKYRLFYSLDPEERAAAGGAAGHRFSLHKKLGDYTLNEQLHDVLKDRQSIETRGLLDRSYRLQALFQSFVEHRLVTNKTLGELQFSTRAPPIFQQFLIERLKLDPETSLSDPQKKEVFLATLRRKQRAAMLQILAESKKQTLPYYGRRIVLALADSCIRDFLDILAAMFEVDAEENFKRAVQRFLNPDSELEPKTQRQGTDKASTAKLNSIIHRPGFGPSGDMIPDAKGTMLAKIVEALGRLTRMLQVSDDGVSSLRTAERGVYVLDMADVRRLDVSKGAIADLVEELLVRAARDNHLVVDPVRLPKAQGEATARSSVLRFRLHRRFSPRFQLSFLGAVEETRLPPDSILQLVAAGSELAVEDWVRTTFRRLRLEEESQTSAQPDLFIRGDDSAE